MNNLKTIKFILILALAALPFFAFASTTDGMIDTTYKYAWGANSGWINLGATNGNVHITDSALTGYAWSENYGWINLNPSNGGVSNNNEGTLSGNAWGQHLGWINFAGVTINSSGQFSGSATVSVDNTKINFDCTRCTVKTDWRPASTRGAVAGATTSGGGGGGMPSDWYYPPKAPEAGFKATINNNAQYTNTPTITLNLAGGPEADRMVISNFPDFRDAVQELYSATKEWNLCQGLSSCPEGAYAVYVKFIAPWGRSSEVVSDNIIYQKKPLLAQIPEFLEGLIPDFLKPKPPIIIPPALPPVEEAVKKETPLSMMGIWQLLPSKPIREFVLSPLPKDIRDLAAKFPTLEKTFQEVGISKITDVQKLKAVELTLPGLTKRMGLPAVKIEPGKFALPKGVPIANLTANLKQQLPAEIVFAKAGGQLIDFNIALTLDEKGDAEQKIATLVGKKLFLAVKPERPVNSVMGYVVFKSKNSRTSAKVPFNQLAASLIFSEPTLSRIQDKSVRIEEKLVLSQFEYHDYDADGIYTAEIEAPVVDGEYEIITVFDYKETTLAKREVREVRLVAVIDPEGYVYEKQGDRETRIPGAVVSLFWLNPETEDYELWPAKEYQQENPQVTDVRGTYSFLVPEGFYYLKVETPGYLTYDGKPFEVKEGSGIHVNIELKVQYWWLKLVDWKTILLVVVILLLLYNFYKDRIREKSK